MTREPSTSRSPCAASLRARSARPVRPTVAPLRVRSRRARRMLPPKMPPFFRRLPFPSLRVRGFVAFVGALSLTACGAKLADPTAGCPTPAGEPTACASDASADGAKDGAFDASCPNPNPGRCAPTTVCTDGFVRTGGASCIDGGWVCEQRACAADAGLDSGVDSACSGTLIPLCSAGHKSALCCPPGAPCLSPEPFCDLGGDAC
jgi:hypothetical protein